MTVALQRLTARARALRSRLAVRRWELRQAGLAAGVWPRLSRRLALTRRAWALSDADAAMLLAAGCSPEPAGLALDPPLRWFVVTEEAALGLPSAREVALLASPELLACRNLALASF